MSNFRTFETFEQKGSKSSNRRNRIFRRLRTFSPQRKEPVPTTGTGSHKVFITTVNHSVLAHMIPGGFSGMVTYGWPSTTLHMFDSYVATTYWWRSVVIHQLMRSLFPFCIPPHNNAIWPRLSSCCITRSIEYGVMETRCSRRSISLLLRQVWYPQDHLLSGEQIVEPPTSNASADVW